MSGRVSIEIIPGGFGDVEDNTNPHHPFVLIDGHLGVPRKVLYATYIAAVDIFTSSRKDQSSASTPQLLASSSVILLANSAHQTALNTRKRLIKTNLLSSHQELDFTAAMIVGCREISKQSVIWDHRRWIFRHLYGPVLLSTDHESLYTGVRGWSSYQNPSQIPTIPLDILEREITIISRSCEAYPRNYHAWTHWHYCMESLYFTLQTLSPTGEETAAYASLVRSEFTRLRRWVEQHISDHSAVHHLCNFVRRFSDVLSSSPSTIHSISSTSLLEHSIELVSSFPDHESLWLYLRAALQFGTVDKEEMMGRMQSLPESGGQYRRQCMKWYNEKCN